MSVIVHRCEDCGHMDLDHALNYGVCAFGYCKSRCQKPRGTIGGPSEVVISYADDHTPIETVTAPGEVFGTTLGGALKTCDCGGCRMVFDSLGGAA